MYFFRAIAGRPPSVVVLEKTRLKEGIVGNASEVMRVTAAGRG